MATLTADELTYYRMLVGDACDVDDLTDAQIQVLYDRALALGLDATTTEAVTVIYMLRALWGLSKNKVTTGGDFGTGGSNEFFRNIKDMLAYYEGLALIGGFSVGSAANLFASSIQLGIDFTEDDLNNPEIGWWAI